jgi:hypothetical protein
MFLNRLVLKTKKWRIKTMQMCLELEVRCLFDINVSILQNDGWMDPKLSIVSAKGILSADPYDLSDLDLALNVIRGQVKMTDAYMVLLSYTMTLESDLYSPLSAIYVHGETEFERIGRYQEYMITGNQVVLIGQPVNKLLDCEIAGFF